MNRTLRHATALTNHREFERLDQSLVQSVVELAGPRSRAVGEMGEVPLVSRLWRPEGPQRGAKLRLTATSDALNGRVPVALACASASAVLKPLLAGTELSEPSDVVMANELSASLALEQHSTIQRVMAADDGQVRYLTWLPVERHGSALAVLEIEAQVPISTGKLTLIQGMCSLYANHLSLLHDSQVDTLTQLLNRKTFDDSVQRILTAPEAGEQAWIAVVDIDHFKRINDGFGHLFGDEVLLLVAGVLRQSFRQQDKVFRFGGEEFVILLQDISKADALSALERFRASIEEKAFPQVGRVTVSVGATSIRAGDTACDVLGRADSALYHAKSHGRNQLQVFEQLQAQGEFAEATALHGDVDLF